MEKITLKFSEENSREAFRAALRTFPVRDRCVSASVMLLSEGIPFPHSDDIRRKISQYMLACEEKRVAPFVRMDLYENTPEHGYFRISSVNVDDRIRNGTSTFIQAVNDIVGRELSCGARPHMTYYTFKSQKAYKNFVLKMGTDHERDKIESMSLRVEYPETCGLLNVVKYFGENNLEVRVSGGFLRYVTFTSLDHPPEKLDFEDEIIPPTVQSTLHNWFRTLQVYGVPEAVK